MTRKTKTTRPQSRFPKRHHPRRPFSDGLREFVATGLTISIWWGTYIGLYELAEIVGSMGVFG